MVIGSGTPGGMQEWGGGCRMGRAMGGGWAAGDAGAGGGRRGLLMAEEYLFLTLFGCITFGVPPLMKLAQLFFNWYNQRPNRTQIETYAEDGDWNFEDEIEGVYIPPDQRAEKEVERGPRGKGRGRKG